MVGLAESPDSAGSALHHGSRARAAPLVLPLNLFGVRDHVLQRDPILDEQANLDVHHTEVRLEVLVGADLLHHGRLQPLALCRGEGEGGRGGRARGGEGRGEGREREKEGAANIKRAVSAPGICASLTELFGEVNIALLQEGQELAHG